MSKSKITTESRWSDHGYLDLYIRKETGKLTLDECVKAIRGWMKSDENGYGSRLNWAFDLVIDAWEEVDDGWYWGEKEGDVQRFSMVMDSERCPVCWKYTQMSCPECGHEFIKEIVKDARSR